MDTETANTVINYLDTISAKLSVMGEAVWPILVMQSMIEGITGIAIWLVCLTMFYYLTKLGRGDKSYFDEDFYIIAWGILGALLVGLTIGLIVEFLPNVINPEYYAIMDIIGH